MSASATMLTVVVAAAFGFTFGYASAHSEVAHECRVLGLFYVGPDVFSCAQKDTK